MSNKQDAMHVATLPTNDPLEAEGPKTNRSIFPHGIKTSGQHPSLEQYLRPFEDFPRLIDGPTAWHVEDFGDSSREWVYRFTAEYLSELGMASDRFLKTDKNLVAMTKVGSRN